jgi:hypothetical protein
VFISPNIFNDAHDTDIDFASEFLEYWLVPLMADSRFNNERTLIILSFDECESKASLSLCVHEPDLLSSLRGEEPGLRDCTWKVSPSCARRNDRQHSYVLSI